LKTKIYISGTSRGLGRALAGEAKKRGYSVFGINRTSDPELMGEEVLLDLSKTDSIPMLLGSIFQKYLSEKSENIILINNAAMIEPIQKLEEVDPLSLAKALELNLKAPMLLSQQFLKGFASLKHCQKTIVNISSGAAFHPIPSWSLYCTAKAGLNIFNQCLAVEHEADSQFRFLNFSPGVLDTDMQAKIRSHSVEEFPLVNRFREFHDQKLLKSPSEVADKLFKFIESDRFQKNYSAQNINLDIEEI
jgi:benzil reductase ((S)-benzoin forming)